MDIKSVFIKVISGVIFTFIVLLVLNKLLGIQNDIPELAITAILIVLFTQLVFKFFKPYTF